VSRNGGWAPRWRRDGKRFLMRVPDQRLQSTPIK
jgi:hypothetical protein